MHNALVPTIFYKAIFFKINISHALINNCPLHFIIVKFSKKCFHPNYNLTRMSIAWGINEVA